MRKRLIVLVLCSLGTLLAQPPYGGRRMGPGRGMGAGRTGAGHTVAGAPYSAVEVRESTQTLANGNVISRKTETNVYRDSMGRVRTETTVQPRVRAGQTSEQAPHTIATIHDPVAGVTTELNSATKTAHEVRMGRGRGANSAATPRAGRGGRQAGGANAATASSNPDVVRESLPMQTINGIQATGTRVTRTIPAGRMGNAQAIQVVHETWMSADLKIPVMVKDTDPRSRTTITQLTNINRSEPDPALFQAPSDYKVTKGGRGRGAAR
jgi:hypothetical protein